MAGDIDFVQPHVAEKAGPDRRRIIGEGDRRAGARDKIGREQLDVATPSRAVAMDAIVRLGAAGTIACEIGATSVAFPPADTDRSAKPPFDDRLFELNETFENVRVPSACRLVGPAV